MLPLRELKERKLIQWVIAYAAGAWVVLQVADLLSTTYAWSPLVMQGLTALLALGIVAALILAWYHGERGAQRISGMEIAMLAALLVIAGGVLSFVGQARTGASDPEWTGLVPVAEQGSIAVLPFADMSPDRDHEYFSDGLTEELLNVLAQLPELRVAARTSSFSFKDRNVAVDSIGRALNVAHVLEGSVRKSGTRVRITAQLINASTGYQLWGETYDRELKDIFAVQDEISRAIVEQLQIRLSAGRPESALAKVQTTDPDAHVLVLRGRHALHRPTPESLAQAEVFLEAALSRDAEYATAHALLAAVYEAQIYRGLIPQAEGLARARTSLSRALSLDPGLAEANVVRGLIAMSYEWDWATAGAHFERALRSNVGYMPAHMYRSTLLMRLGRTEEAIRAAERAVELDPVSASAVSNLATKYADAGQRAKEIEHRLAAVALAPGSISLRSLLAISYSDAGQDEDAVREARQAAASGAGHPLAMTALAYAYARAGRRPEAKEALETLEELGGATYNLAIVHAGLGDRAQALALLEQAVEERDPFVPNLGIDPIFREYRRDARAQALLKRMGLI